LRQGEDLSIPAIEISISSCSVKAQFPRVTEYWGTAFLDSFSHHRKTGINLPLGARQMTVASKTMLRRVDNPSAPFLLYSIAEEWRFQKCPYYLSPERDRVNAMFFFFILIATFQS
jgi:hypothetical protein